MGQKVNPHGLRVGVIKNWDSRWFVEDKQFGDTLVSDYNIRKFLKNTNKIAAEHLIKLLKSAVANAEHNFNMDAANLYVSECFVCPGPTLKRIQPRAQGRAFHILKRTSHVTLVVKEKEVG